MNLTRAAVVQRAAVRRGGSGPLESEADAPDPAGGAAASPTRCLQRTPATRSCSSSARIEKTLAAASRRSFASAGIEVALIEPIGLNSGTPSRCGRTARPATASSSTSARGVHDGRLPRSQPVFLRSRNLSGERTLQQEIRLSASYLRDSLRTDKFAQLLRRRHRRGERRRRDRPNSPRR